MLKVSLIIAVYERADFLSLVLESLKRQSLMPFEVIITEDGQSSAIRQAVAGFSALNILPVVHVHQHDAGNRKPLALNRAIAASRGDYLVFIDGDCVLQKDFIQAHVDLSEDKAFLTGRRIELSQSASQQVTPEAIAHGYLDGYPLPIIWDGVFGETRGWKRMFKTPRALRGLLKRDEIDDIRGCNFSVAKKHLVAINGFCNDFSGAYGEDSDVEYRLKFLGLKMKGNKGAAIQYHLWHPEQKKDLENQKLLKALEESKNPVTPNGLAQIAGFAP